MSMNNFDNAITAFKNGELIIVTDDADRENEGDLFLLAEKATPEKVAFMVRYTTGILCVALTEKRARQLHLPLMMKENQDPKKTAFTVSVDVKAGMTTGLKNGRTRSRHLLLQALWRKTLYAQVMFFRWSATPADYMLETATRKQGLLWPSMLERKRRLSCQKS